jgi:hypothetical protein
VQESEVIFVDDDTCPSQGDGTSGAPYCSLQDGVDAATSDPLRNTVLVADGTYGEIQLSDAGELWIVGRGSMAEVHTQQNERSALGARRTMVRQSRARRQYR